MLNHLKYMTLSDIHLGHDTNKTKDIIRNLDSFFIKYKKDIMKIDILFILGDVFDKLLSNSNADTILTYAWLSRLVVFCKEYHIKLRILEGTPGHDWKQVRVIDTIIDNLKIDLDYKYFDTLHIEHIDKYGIDVLYIPDEYNHKASDTFSEVKQLLIDKHIDKVDLVIMHGSFSYQIPYTDSEAFHSEEDYLSITRHTINIGHVHHHSQFERILVPGSFDRLTHIDAKDEYKGALLIDIDLKNIKFTYKMLPNVNALQFITIHVDDIDTVNINKQLDILNKKNKKIHVRLYSKDKSNKLSFSVRELEHQYTNLVIKYTNKLEKTHDTNIQDNGSVTKSEIARVSLKIDKGNITDIVTNELDSMALDKYVKELVISELKELM